MNNTEQSLVKQEQALAAQKEEDRLARVALLQQQNQWPNI